MKDLIAKLEAATEGSHTLSRSIAEALGWEVFDYTGMGAWMMKRPEQYRSDSVPMPYYTTSLDAALTLVPEGYTGLSASFNERGKSSVRIGHPYVHGAGWTPALALCIAALHARSAQ